MIPRLRHIFALAIMVTLLTAAGPAEATYSDPPWSTGESRGEDLSIQLVTFSQGDDIPSWFGHTALLVRDNRLGVERIYNYGMFDFGPDMLPKFMMGRLEFWVGEASVPRTMRLYRSLKRDIIVQELNLSPESRLEMAKFLAWNVLPENRDYLYDHYGDNCATRIRDAIDDAVDGQFKEEMVADGRMSLREHTRRHSQRNPYIDALLMLWMNDDIDEPIRKWDEMFLPEELHDRIAEFEYVDEEGKTRPLVKEERVIYDAPDRGEVPEEPNAAWIYMLICGLLLGAIAFGLARWHAGSDSRGPRVVFGGYTALVGLFVGLPGTIIPLFHLTDHLIAQFNENALLTSPLTGLALPLGIAIVFGARRPIAWLKWAWTAHAALTIVGIAFKVLPWFDQDNWMLIAFFLPLNVGFAAAFWLVDTRQKTDRNTSAAEKPS